MGITLSMMRSLMGIVVGKGTFPWTNIRVQPGEVTMVLHMGLELWDREEENPKMVDLLEAFLGIFPRKDIRVEKVEVVFHMDLELGDKEESTTVVEVREVEELL